MSYPNQNGAIPGPSISPRLPRCCWLLIDIFFSILIAFLIVGGVIIPVIRHKVRTHIVQFYATNATLSTFNFTNNINFNLALSLRSFNPDPRTSIYYDGILVDAIYEGKRLKTINAVTILHNYKHKNAKWSPSSEPGLVFNGQNVVVLASYDKSEFDKQSKQGVYEIEVKLHIGAGLEVGLFKFGTWMATVDCDLNVPLAGKSSATFQETKCLYYF